MEEVYEGLLSVDVPENQPDGLSVERETATARAIATATIDSAPTILQTVLRRLASS